MAASSRRSQSDQGSVLGARPAGGRRGRPRRSGPRRSRGRAGRAGSRSRRRSRPGPAAAGRRTARSETPAPAAETRARARRARRRRRGRAPTCAGLSRKSTTRGSSQTSAEDEHRRRTKRDGHRHQPRRRSSSSSAAAALPQAISMPATSSAEAFSPARRRPVTSVIRRGQTISRSSLGQLDEQPVAPRRRAAAGVGATVPVVGDRLALGQRDVGVERADEVLVLSTIADPRVIVGLADEEGDPRVVASPGDQRRLAGR